MTELQSQVAVRIIHLSGAECREPSAILFREVQKSILDGSFIEFIVPSNCLELQKRTSIELHMV